MGNIIYRKTISHPGNAPVSENNVQNTQSQIIIRCWLLLAIFNKFLYPLIRYDRILISQKVFIDWSELHLMLLFKSSGESLFLYGLFLRIRYPNFSEQIIERITSTRRSILWWFKLGGKDAIFNISFFQIWFTYGPIAFSLSFPLLTSLNPDISCWHLSTNQKLGLWGFDQSEAWDHLL